jgi:hypothetical protein
MKQAPKTERAAFEQWAPRQWKALSIDERAEMFVRAHDRVAEIFRDDLGQILLAGASLPGNFSAVYWREMIRAFVAGDLWYKWNEMQVVAEGLIGIDHEISAAAVDRSFDAEHSQLTDAVESGELNHVVAYHVDPDIAFRFEETKAAS